MVTADHDTGAGHETWRPPRARSLPLRAARRAAVIAYTSSWTRRLLPVAVVFPLIDALATQTQRRRTAAWQENVRFHAQLLAHTDLRGSEEEVARRAVREIFQCLEIFWRPWLMRRGEVHGLETYREAAAQRRGVLTVFPHFGMTYAQLFIMRRFDIDAWIAVSSYHYEASGNGYDARFSQRGRDYVELLGRGRGVSRPASDGARESLFPRLLEMLRSGITVSIAFDIAGSMPTPFLGRKLSLTGGPARLAMTSDALVVPIVVRRRGAIPVLHFASALDPRDFGDEVELQGAIARQMEAWALERPEAVWQLRSNHPGGPPLIAGPDLEASVPEAGAR